MNEFAEAYKITGNAKIYGTYIVNPAISKMSDLEVEITVYNGSDKPETLLYSESFSPSFVTLNDKSAFIDSTKPMNRDQESFITFKEPIDVSGNFFIGYKIKSAAGNIFFRHSISRKEKQVKYRMDQL